MSTITAERTTRRAKNGTSNKYDFDAYMDRLENAIEALENQGVTREAILKLSGLTNGQFTAVLMLGDKRHAHPEPGHMQIVADALLIDPTWMITGADADLPEETPCQWIARVQKKYGRMILHTL